MGFAKIATRQSSYPDFRVGFLGIQDGQARITVSVKEPATFVQRVFGNESDESPWFTFYSDISAAGNITNLGQLGLGKTVSEYVPIHSNNPTFNPALGPFLPGGEFLIPIKETIYFWVQIPVLVFGNIVAVGQNSDPITEGNRLKISFGPEIPDLEETSENGSYKFPLPIFRINVSQTSVNLQNYDCGECVFMSSDFDVSGENFFEFSRASSYYD